MELARERGVHFGLQFELSSCWSRPPETTAISTDTVPDQRSDSHLQLPNHYLQGDSCYGIVVDRKLAFGGIIVDKPCIQLKNPHPIQPVNPDKISKIGRASCRERV